MPSSEKKSHKETEEERRERKERERAERKAKESAGKDESHKETEEERRERKERERAERKAKESVGKEESHKETEEERRERKERERAERKAKESAGKVESHKETEEERRERKERERAERKAKESVGKEESHKETEEERRERKERERAERKAKESAGKEESHKETEEERRERKERERAERKAKESAGKEESHKETEEERRERKERERAERKAKESAGKEESHKETEEERRERKERERAERKAQKNLTVDTEGANSQKKDEKESSVEHNNENQLADLDESPTVKSSPLVPPRNREKQELLRAITEENRLAGSKILSRGPGAPGEHDELPNVDSPATQEREKRREERQKRKEERLRQQKNEQELTATEGVGRSADGLSGASRGAGSSPLTLNNMELERQGYQPQFEKDLQRATVLRRLVDFDDFYVVVLDMAPQTEYEMYIRNFGKGKTVQVGTSAPDEEDHRDVGIQVERSKRKEKEIQAPDDLGIYPEGLIQQRWLGNAEEDGQDSDHEDGVEEDKKGKKKKQLPRSPAQRGPSSVQGTGASSSSAFGQPPSLSTGEDNEAKNGMAASGVQGATVDVTKLGTFLYEVSPIMCALLDENAEIQMGGTDSPTGKTTKSTDAFSTSFTILQFPMLSSWEVRSVRFSARNSQSLAALYRRKPETGNSSELDRFGSVILQWNTHDTLQPERILVSFAPLTCVCFSPSRTHILYAGTEDGGVCVWDTREPDRQHRSAGKFHNFVYRLPSYSTSWKQDNHRLPVESICVAGYNTVVGVRKDKFEQVVTLDRSGQIKFWALNDNIHTTKDATEHDHGLHVSSQVRLTLSSTRETKHMEENVLGDTGVDTRLLTSTWNNLTSSSARGASAGCSFLEARTLDFSPSDASKFVVGMSEGLFHADRFGATCAPSIYRPLSQSTRGGGLSLATLEHGPMPYCAEYSVLDSRLLVAGYDDGAVRLFIHTESQPQLTVPLPGLSPVKSVRFSSIRWHTWALDESGMLHLLDHAHKNREVPLLSEKIGNPEVGTCLSFDIPYEEKTDHHILALGFERGVIQLHNLDSEKIQRLGSDRDELWV